MKPLLEARDLSLRFGGIAAADRISLSLAPGARHALIGPNGAGKTTLVNLLTGVLRPDAGRILLDGQDIVGLPPHRRAQRGLVRTFQVSQLFGSLTPRQTLSLAVAQQQGEGDGWWTALRQRRAVVHEAEGWIARFRLDAVADLPVQQLAYGQRRLLDIALALACRPRVLLLDEPAAGVPAAERTGLLAVLDALPHDVAVLLIEHDMDLVFRFARQVTVLAEGAVLASGSSAEVAADARVRAVYLGDAGNVADTVHG